MAEISEILESGIVFLDRCAVNRWTAPSEFCLELIVPSMTPEEKRAVLRTGGCFIDHLLADRDYVQIDTDCLAEETQKARYFAELLQHPNAVTVPGVTEEINALELIINGSKRKWDLRIASKSFRSPRKVKGNKPMRAVAGFQEALYTLRRTAWRKEFQRHFPINGRNYEALAEIVKVLSRATRVKKQSDYVRGKRDTDERLVAAAYYLCMHSDKKLAVVSADTDMVKLMGVIPRLMGAADFLPENEKFRQALAANPVVLYLRTREGYTPFDFQSAGEYQGNFRVYKIDDQRNQQLKEWIKVLWQRASQ